VVVIAGCAGKTPMEKGVEQREMAEREKAFPDMSFENQNPKRKASLQITQEGFRESNNGYYIKAVKRYEQAIDIDSSNPYAYYYYGVARYGMKEYEQSVRLLDEARTKFGKNELWLSKIFSYKGLNYRAMGRTDLSREAFKKALELDDRNEIALRGMEEIGSQ
jgi:tetratricopeptide (TPR) repeat protein